MGRAMAGGGFGGGWGPGPLLPWMRNLMLGLFGMHIVELLLRNNDVPVDFLAWWPVGSGQFMPWQPVTHFVLQGRSVFATLIGLLVIYFFLPTLNQLFSRRQLLEVMGMAAVGGIAVGFGLDLIGLSGGKPAVGWSSFIFAAAVLFGLRMPEATIRLWFVIPVQGWMFVWAAFAIAAVGGLMSPGIDSGESLGAWLGAYAWNELRGPGARRRALLREARRIEDELNRFQVIDGGLSDRPQGGQDDTVH